ncbi:primase homolog protein-like isoform X2 [Cornus florida]|uniref:primase homolog protein-like isoform X2 n=1 Tax=Cornus florida TaxID=4283 RepID=UPI00289F554E|nr:primase homolog protein-like isoform X2 [Cornus florida]
MSLPHCLLRPIHKLRSSASPLCNCNSVAATTRTTTAAFVSNTVRLHQFQIYSLLFSASPPKPISKFHPFSLYSSGSRSIFHARVSQSSVKVENHEEEETSTLAKMRVLKQNIERLGINYDSCTPGQYNNFICPKCKGGQLMERSLSFHIAQNRDFAMWRCFRVECGWAGQVFADNRETCNGVNQKSDINSSRQITEESLRLEPLGDELIEYFAQRMISEEILQKNAVRQISGDQKVIAFTYRRNGLLVSCKYRSIEKRFWQEKGTEKILYGLDDIEKADEIIIVEGEIDKLSMEEAGFCNCVSVPDGAPQKVSTKDVPPIEKDTRFQYLWNCREYLDKASRIILATDGDIPGQVLAEELARRLGRERCWQVSWPKKDEFSCFKDANEVLKNLGSDGLRDIIYSAEVYQVHTLD